MDLGKLLGITPQGYGMYELGKRNVDTEMLNKLVKYYNVSPGYIMGLTDDDSPFDNNNDELDLGQYDDVDLKKILQTKKIKFNGEYLTDQEKARILGYLDGFKQN